MTKHGTRTAPAPRKHKLRWRFYETEGGNSPVRKFLDDLPAEHVAEVLAEMKHVGSEGLRAARNLRGDIYEVRATAGELAYRILFAKEGHTRTILLALEGFPKKTQRTPQAKIELAEQRLSDWRTRGKAMKAGTSGE